MPATTRHSLPAQLKPEQVVVVVDSREQAAWDLTPLQTVPGCLPTGDYALQAAPELAVVERKSLPDLLGCVGAERPRFERELRRMLGYPTRAVVCEFAWADVEAGQWRNKLTPSHVAGSILGWVGWGVPFILAGSRESAARATARLLYLVARRQWRQARAFAAAIAEAEPPTPEEQTA